jgi:hypothetical protein
MAASKGATSESRRPGSDSASTRRLKVSALPVGTRQPCRRSKARVRAM